MTFLLVIILCRIVHGRNANVARCICRTTSDVNYGKLKTFFLIL